MTDTNRTAEDVPGCTYRRIIQISTVQTVNTVGTQCNWLIYALCDDGTLWEKADTSDWVPVDTRSVTGRKQGALP